MLYFLIVSLSLNVLLGAGFFASWWTDRDMRLHRKLAKANGALQGMRGLDRVSGYEWRTLNAKKAELEMRLHQLGEPLDRYEDAS